MHNRDRRYNLYKTWSQRCCISSCWDGKLLLRLALCGDQVQLGAQLAAFFDVDLMAAVFIGTQEFAVSGRAQCL